MRRVLLFDIDGTLTRSVYSSSRNPILDSMAKVYEKPIEKNGVIFSGGTDRSIIRGTRFLKKLRTLYKKSNLRQNSAEIMLVINDIIYDIIKIKIILKNLNHLLYICNKIKCFSCIMKLMGSMRN